MKKEYLYRAMFYTMSLIEKEEEINEWTIKHNGHENSISIFHIEKYKNEVEELHTEILKIEQAEQ